MILKNTRIARTLAWGEWRNISRKKKKKQEKYNVKQMKIDLFRNRIDRHL